MTRILLLAMAVLAAARAMAGGFDLRDGDTVVFLGDSITAERTYGKIVENYTLLRFPERGIRFINMGKGGDTAEGGLKRLEKDVFAHGATVLLVAYGINDIGWGMKADAVHRKLYLDSIRGIVEACTKRKVRVYICSAAITGADPDKTETDFLQRMCDDGMALSRSLGGGAIDVQRGMRSIQRRVWEHNARTTDTARYVTLHEKDTIHLNQQGQMAMAFAILKGLGAPSDVSSATLDAAAPRAVSAENCRIGDVARAGKGIEFTRLDEALPINFGLIGHLSYWFIPIPDELDRYMLTVLNLPAGTYRIEADGRFCGRFTSEQLAAGVNLATVSPDNWEPGGPWYSKSSLLQMATDGRHNFAMTRRYMDWYLPSDPNAAQIDRQIREIDDAVVRLQRTLARPAPFRFSVRPVQ